MKATRTVFCYYYPEVRKVIDKLVEKFPHEVFLQSIDPGLDKFHISVIDKYLNFVDDACGLRDFNHQYFTAGASEGIFHFLVKIKKENPDTIIYVLRGEYEGYKAYGEEVGLTVIEINEDENFSNLEPGIWFISNASARDGNIIENSFINRICETHKVIYDITYVGLTKQHEFVLTNPHIIGVVGSMSKSFGLYYYRVGFTFSRKPVNSLMSNKWFKSIFALMVADKVLSTFKKDELYNKYRPFQETVVKYLNFSDNSNFKVSDVMLLAYTEDKIKEFMRGDKFCRICLTPYFLEEEKVNQFKEKQNE